MLQSHNPPPGVSSPAVHIQQHTVWIQGQSECYGEHKNIFPLPGIEHRVLSQPVSSYCYLDWAVLNENYKDVVNSNTMTFPLNVIQNVSPVQQLWLI
jgi:hypothetical protein